MDSDSLPFSIATPDQSTLLTVTKIKLASDCLTAELPAERLVIKGVAGRTYLIMSQPQWSAIKLFRDGKTVPEVLMSLLESRRCIPLTEFYELVVKACNRGILQAEGYPAPERIKSSNFTIQLRGYWLRIAAVGSILAALGSLLIRPINPNIEIWAALLAYIQVAAALSLGNFLGAGVARHGGCEVYGAGMHWRSWLPRYRADIWDAIMGGHQLLVDANLARLAPVFLTMAVAAFLTPASVIYILLTAIFLLCPLFRTPGWAVLNFIYGKPNDDAVRRFEFLPNREIRNVIRSYWESADWRFFTLQTLHTTMWLVLVTIGAALPLPDGVTTLWEHIREGRAWPVALFALITVFAATGLSALGILCYVLYLNARDWWRQRFPRSAQMGTIAQFGGELNRAAIKEVLAQTYLFRNFKDEDLASLAEGALAESFKSGDVVIREGDPGDRLYIVFSGKVQVHTTTPTGRQQILATLASTAIFGEVALLADSPRTRTVTMVESGILLSLSREIFRKLVLSRFSRQEVETAIQKASFLSRINLSRHWTPAAITAFARLSTIESYTAGQNLIRAGTFNPRFQIVYEGEMSVRRGGEELARLHTGDFFGEIGIMRNSTAEASVIALTAGRILWMHRDDFLRFMANDFLVGLFFERMGKRRLGRAVFVPKHTPTFETLHR